MIATLDDVKQALHLTTTDAARDSELQRLIDGATQIIEDIVGPCSVQQFTERHDSGPSLMLRRTPVVSVTSVTPWLSAGSTYDPAALVVDPETGIVEHAIGMALSNGPFRVVYTAGRSTVPANIVQACIDLVRINFRPSQAGNLARFDGTDGQVRPDLGMFVPNSVLANLAPQIDYGIA